MRPRIAASAPRAPFPCFLARRRCPQPPTLCRRPWTCRDCSRTPARRSTTTRPVERAASRFPAQTLRTRNPPHIPRTIATAVTKAQPQMVLTLAPATRLRKRLFPLGGQGNFFKFLFASCTLIIAAAKLSPFVYAYSVCVPARRCDECWCDGLSTLAVQARGVNDRPRRRWCCPCKRQEHACITSLQSQCSSAPRSFLLHLLYI